MKKTILLALFIFSTETRADLSLGNLDTNELEDISQDLGANFSHTTVSPASPLGRIFGFEFGLVFGATQSPAIEDAAKQTDPTAEDVPYLGHAAFVGLITLPLGFTLEAGVFPTYEGDDAEVGSRSFAVKWTYSTLFDSPVDLSVKFHGAASETKFTGDDPVPNTSIEFETNTSGILFQVSKSFAIIEPYFGGGFVSIKSDVSASQTVFVDKPGAYSQSVDISGSHFVLGMNLNLVIFKFGVEAGRIFENNLLNLKTTFYF